MAAADRRRPRIAIPARFSASASALRYGAEVTSRNLVEAVFAAGGEPLMMHPHAAADDEVAERLAVAEGVLLPGGGDVAAHRFGQQPHPAQYDVDEEQDAFDLAVARVALGHGIPLLAVCRGLQVVTAALGGTLVQDMDEHPPLRHHRHHRHIVKIEPGTRLGGLLPGPADVSCYHHQALDALGRGMQAVAWSEEGVVEAVEIPAAAGWFLGVQWHPEDTWQADPQQFALFSALVNAARG